ncbi:MAG: hypothetical protein Q8S32_11375 [Burkholderiaceae bacterium]|nr:hypothetical protein [Burkholderiaceae bacterium]
MDTSFPKIWKGEEKVKKPTKNPFSESPLTEHIAADDFVRIFSPELVKQVMSLFDRGNVILKGTPGSGKTMLLSLFKLDTRIAYAREKKPFPVPKENLTFISAEINLTRVRAYDIAHRLSQSSTEDEKRSLAFSFGDYFNHHLVRSLLVNLKLLCTTPQENLRTECGVSLVEYDLDGLAERISGSGSWMGGLKGVKTFDQLVSMIDQRISDYRGYFSLNRDLPQRVLETRTEIGEPLSEVAGVLKEMAFISAKTNVIAVVDQLEELYQIEDHYEMSGLFRQVVNRALGLRDGRVSYRIGTRSYAWSSELKMFGASQPLEETRDFIVEDIDLILKRDETGRWYFPALACDVFQKRLEAAGYIGHSKFAKEAFREFVGKPLDRGSLARLYAGKSPERILRINTDWPAAWKTFLNELVKRDPLSAKFGEAWVQQKGKQSLIQNHEFYPLPWESTSKKWWRKERNELALSQIAAAAGQRMIWSGDDDILELSGGNTLGFITICKHVWQAWMRTEEFEFDSKLKPSAIPPQVQASGIFDASRMWVEKISPQRYNGSTRQKIVLALAHWFRRKLATDMSMSNPGHNGFSLSVEDLARFPQLEALLNLCCDFGDLVSYAHTTKTSDKKERRKWYLAPLSSPFYRIPHIHTKEPIYATAIEVMHLLANQLSEGTWGVSLKIEPTINGNLDSNQMSLFSKGD